MMNLSQLIKTNRSIAINEPKSCMELIQSNTSPTEKATFSLIAVFQGILIVVMNTFIIVAIKKTNQKSQSIKLLRYNAILNIISGLGGRTCFLFLLNFIKSLCSTTWICYSISIFLLLAQTLMVLLINYDRYIHVKHLDRYRENFNGSKMNRYLSIIILYITVVSITSGIIFVDITSNFLVAFTITASSAAVIYLQLQSFFLLKQYRNDSKDVTSYIDDRVLLLVRLYTASYFLCRAPMAITFILLNFIPHRKIIILVILFGQILSNTDIIINSFLFIYVNNPTRIYFKKMLCHGSQVAPN